MHGNRSHLAFGGGPHECPGQDIGRVIAEVGVDALLTRLPDVQLACDEDELGWWASISNRHLVELPVKFEAKPQQDVMARPAHPLALQRSSNWLVSTPQSKTAPPEATSPTTAPMPTAVPTPTPEPAGRTGVFRRLLNWWRGE
jgi:hypothetical protein